MSALDPERRPNPKDLLGVLKPRVDLVPPALLLHVSQAMTDGAAKYGPFNWRDHPVQLTIYIAASMRHLLALLDGENTTADSGHHHAAHVAACMGIILDALETGNLVDDRPKPGPAARLIVAMTKQAGPMPATPQKGETCGRCSGSCSC